MSHRQVCAKGIGTDYGIHIPWPQRRSWPGGGAGAPGRKMVGLGVVSLSIVRLVGGALCAGGARRESQTADCEPTSVFSHYSTIEIYNTSAQWRQVCRGRRRGGAAQPVRVHIYRPMKYRPGGRAGMANALRGIVPRPPGGVQGTYTVLWSKERIKHPGARGKTLVKALEPPTPQHPPAPLTRLPNTIPP